MPLTLFTFQSIFKGLQVVIDFAILWVVIYYVLRIVRNNSRTVQIFKGIILVIALWYVSSIMKLSTIKSLLDYVIQYAFLVVVIIFSPEIRGMLERLGKTSVFSALHSLSGNEKEQLVDELVEAAIDLSKRRVGALITIEQGHSLSDYVKTGTPINSSVTSELLSSIFVTSTPLHDGAVIIQGDRIACASAYFPPTNLDLPTSYGARHRAAIGLSEVTDSVTIVVSEETGRISIAEGGRLREMDEVSLRDYLNLIIQNSEKEVSQSIGLRRQRRMNLSRLNLDPIKVEKYEEVERQPKKVVDTRVDEDKPDFSKLMSIFKKKPKKEATVVEPKEEDTASKLDLDRDQIKVEPVEAIVVDVIQPEETPVKEPEIFAEELAKVNPETSKAVKKETPVVKEVEKPKAKSVKSKILEISDDVPEKETKSRVKAAATKKEEPVEESTSKDSKSQKLKVNDDVLVEKVKSETKTTKVKETAAKKAKASKADAKPKAKPRKKADSVSIKEDIAIKDIGGETNESEEK